MKKLILFGLAVLGGVGIVFATSIVWNVEDIPMKNIADGVKYKEFNTLIQTTNGLYHNDGGTLDVFTDDMFGLGVPNPLATLSLNGAMKVGNTGAVCNSLTEGGVRFNDISLRMEFCDGTSWRAFRVLSDCVPTACSASLGTCTNTGVISCNEGVPGVCDAIMPKVTSWAPATSTECVGTSFTQTSNCGTKRTAMGIKVPESAATTCGQAECGSIQNNCGTSVNCGTCASGSVCSSGVCTTIACTAGSCDDGNACTDDVCSNPGTVTSVCVFTNNDANTCGTGNYCSAGSCVGATCTNDSDCSADSNICTTATCVGTGADAACVQVNNTKTESCTGTFGTCTSTGVKTCSNGVLGTCDAVTPTATCDVGTAAATCNGEVFADSCGELTCTGTKTTGSCCTATSWTPATSTKCSGTSFTQTSNCDTQRTATGTKTDGTCSPDCAAGSGLINNFGSYTVSGVTMGDLTWTWPAIADGSFSGTDTVTASETITGGRLDFNFSGLCSNGAVVYTGNTVSSTTSCDSGFTPSGSTCVVTTCVPESISDTCAQAQIDCGSVQNNCGISVDCECSQQGYTCIDERCVEECIPVSQSTACSSSCGSVDDGCGGTISCNTVWTPDAGATCFNSTVNQTSQCGTSRAAIGSLVDSSCCTSAGGTWTTNSADFPSLCSNPPSGKTCKIETGSNGYCVWFSPA